MQTTLLDPAPAPAFPDQKAIAGEASQRAGRLDLMHRAAQAFAIENDADFELAAFNAQNAKTIGAEAEEWRLAITRPMDAAKQNVMDLFRPITSTASAIIELYKGKMLAYSRKKESERAAAEKAARDAAAELERQQREAADKLQREADEKAARDRASAEAELRAAASTGDTAAAMKAAERIDQVDATHQAETEVAGELKHVQVAPLPVMVSRPKASGVSTRKTWKAEVTDKVAFIRAAAAAAAAGNFALCAMLDVDQGALNKYASAIGGASQLDGVRFYEDANVALRGRK